MTESSVTGQGCGLRLAESKCVPCAGGVPPLKGKQLDKLAREIPAWHVVNEHHLAKTFKFANFVKSLEFINRVGAIAEEQGHHPWIHFTWGKATIEIWTHKIDGLTESDFVLAAKIDALPRS